MPKQLDLTQSFVKSVLDYEPGTGVFVWRLRHPDKKGWNKRRAGTVAGTKTANGYRAINFYGIPRYEHRLAFLWMEGSVPEMIDHKDRDRSNNRWDNLRPATNSLNLANAKLRANNVSGLKGVCWYPPLGQWHAQIHKDNKRIHLGYFDHIEEAAAAYAKAAADIFGEFARPI